MRSARSRASTCSIVSSRAWSWRSLYSTPSADVATPVGYACRLLGTGAVLFAARCALPAMVGGTLALVGRLAVGSSLFLIAGASRYSFAKFLLADAIYGVFGVGLFFFGWAWLVELIKLSGHWAVYVAAV